MGSAVGPATTLPDGAKVVRHKGSDPVQVDVIAGLAPTDSERVSWLDPGPARLALGGPAFDAIEGAPAIPVVLLEQQGTQLHVGVQLESARFAVWVERARLLAVITRDVRVADYAGGGGGDFSTETEATIHANAHVYTLAHRDKWTQVRYAGALEIQGWVPDAVVAQSGGARDAVGRFPTGHSTLMVMPGAVVRSEPKWQGRVLATVSTGYLLDSLKELDEAWVEVAYEDGDLRVHGFLSRHDPPGRLHQRARQSDANAVLAVPNAVAPSGTCLYARAGGDQLGYTVGDRPVELVENTQPGWSALAFDTPWGPIAFAAKGATRGELEACAPPGSVPVPASAAPPSAP